MNWYRYCSNIPLSLIDWMGLEEDLPSAEIKNNNGAKPWPQWARKIDEGITKFLCRNLMGMGPATYAKTMEGRIIPMSENGEDFAYSERVTDLNSFLASAFAGIHKLTKAQNVLTEFEGKTVNTNISKGELLKENNAKGKAFENETAPKVTEAGYSAKTQVTAKSASGATIRIDDLAVKDGEMKIFEFKSSATAPYTANQKDAGYIYKQLLNDYTVVVNNGGDLFPAGTKIPAGTPIETIRPGDIIK